MRRFRVTHLTEGFEPGSLYLSHEETIAAASEAEAIQIAAEAYTADDLTAPQFRCEEISEEIIEYDLEGDDDDDA